MIGVGQAVADRLAGGRPARASRPSLCSSSTFSRAGLGRRVEQRGVEPVASRRSGAAGWSGRYSAPTTTTVLGFCSNAAENWTMPIPRIG